MPTPHAPTPAPQDASPTTHGAPAALLDSLLNAESIAPESLARHAADPAASDSLDQLEAFLERTLRLRLLTAAADAVDALTRLLHDEKTTPTDRRRAATTILRALTPSHSPPPRPPSHPTRTPPTEPTHTTAQPTPRAPHPSPSQISNLKSASPPPPRLSPAPPDTRPSNTPPPQPTSLAPQPPPSQISNLKSSSSPTPSLSAAAALLARAGLAPAQPP